MIEITFIPNWFRCIPILILYPTVSLESILKNSTIYPSHQDSAINLNREMSYYNPYEQYDLQELRLTELFKDALVCQPERADKL